ncbi:Glycosyl transferase family 8 [Geosmithia morbida]|uniref:glycogenin glucosyltransferase n=1 Tax=Geosmithia morbida TaxID=1094350 RepID=A0A9P4YMG8_9HYPO|nr:Glycosyl transferase family 8 [Geosmithia morbida]KAF4119676.1 Glycosyl transferase family 8 [Geosmithia morbida]
MAGHSTANSGTTVPLCVLVIPAVSEGSKRRLECLFDHVIPVPPITGISAANLELIGRPDLHTTLTKLNLWTLDQYERVLYLDADTLVLSNLDHLFSLPDHIGFAASPDVGFPDCFNSGVMLLKPNKTTYMELSRLAGEVESFDGGDQGLLNIHFGDGTLGHPVKRLLSNQESPDPAARAWFRLSFTYNMQMHKVYRLYVSAVLRYRSQHKVIHFLGKDKPWNFPDGKVEAPEDTSAYFEFYCDMVSRWWHVRRQVESNDSKAGGRQIQA